MVKSFPSRSSECFDKFSISRHFDEGIYFGTQRYKTSCALLKNKLSSSVFLLLLSVTSEVDPRFHKLTNKIQQLLVIDGK